MGCNSRTCDQNLQLRPLRLWEKWTVLSVDEHREEGNKFTHTMQFGGFISASVRLEEDLAEQSIGCHL